MCEGEFGASVLASSVVCVSFSSFFGPRDHARNPKINGRTERKKEKKRRRKTNNESITRCIIWSGCQILQEVSSKLLCSRMPEMPIQRSRIPGQESVPRALYHAARNKSPEPWESEPAYRYQATRPATPPRRRVERGGGESPKPKAATKTRCGSCG